MRGVFLEKGREGRECTEEGRPLVGLGGGSSVCVGGLRGCDQVLCLHGVTETVNTRFRPWAKESKHSFWQPAFYSPLSPPSCLPYPDTAIREANISAVFALCHAPHKAPDVY